MSHAPYLEIGRVCALNYGDNEGKLCTVVDVIDQNSALIDGPEDLTGITRQVVNFKRLNITHFQVPVKRGARHTTLVKAWKKADVLNKWEKTPMAKKFKMQKRRRELTDFDRFNVMILRKKKSQFLNREVKKVKKSKK